MRHLPRLLLALTLAGCGAPASSTSGLPDGALPSDAAISADAPAPQGDAGASGYSETLCPTLNDLGELSAMYQNSAMGLRAAARGIAERRYPVGVAFIDVQTDQQLGTWFRDRNSFNAVLNSFEVGIHEGQHIWDLTMISAQGWPYRIREDLVIRTRRLMNFNRSEILTVHPNATADSYARVYLMGQSGAQGFNTLLDEYVAYTHSLASRYCTRDALSQGIRISARDGILAMMFYVGAYLRLARTQHADDYAEILADREHVRLVLTVWARAEFLLRLATDPRLGLRDTMYREWAYAPDNTAEIDRLRALQ